MLLARLDRTNSAAETGFRERQDIDYREFQHSYEVRTLSLAALEQSMQNDVNQRKVDEEMAKQKLDMELDRELEATFPASAALNITRTHWLRVFSRQTRIL
jgi:hypothetical protein